MIGLDNNPAERAIRRPVVTRRNAYGSRNDDAARLAVRIWTITATAEMAGLNVTTYLTAYLDACGRNSGKAPVGDGPRTVPALERRPGWQGSLEPAATARLTRVRPASPRRRPCEPVTPAAGIERPGSRIPSPPPLAGPRAGESGRPLSSLSACGIGNT
jgi:Transposase IS66 family